MRVWAKYTYQDLNLVDTEAWSALRRVAAFVMSPEVAEMIIVRRQCARKSLAFVMGPHA